MAAAAFKATVVVQNSAGQRVAKYYTVSDVNAAFYIALSGGTELPLSALPCKIVDIILSAAGTDTSTASIFINGADSSGVRIVNSANVSTVLGRQFQSAPLAIPAGALVKFTQNT
jgi:hypothetical protein